MSKFFNTNRGIRSQDVKERIANSTKEQIFDASAALGAQIMDSYFTLLRLHLNICHKGNPEVPPVKAVNIMIRNGIIPSNLQEGALIVAKGVTGEEQEAVQ